MIERIRKLAVAFRRDADHEADRALKAILKALTGEQTVSVIRAFTYFSHLANLAEDRHHIRLHRAKINTLGSRAEDVFWISGAALAQPELTEALRNALLKD